MSTRYFTAAHINANAATTVLPGSAGGVLILHTVVINTKGASANVLTIFDAATAGQCTAANTIAVIDTTSGVVTLTYDIVTHNGLFYTLATGTAADVTVNWG